jgi:hypothetical protein
VVCDLPSGVPVRISAGALAVLAEVFLGEGGIFPKPVQKNIGVVPLLGHDRFLPNNFEFVIRQSYYHSALYSQIY